MEKSTQKKLLFILPILVLLTGILLHLTQKNGRELYEEQLSLHPFNQKRGINCYDLRKIPKKDRPDLAWEQDFLKTMDPKLGRPARERLLLAYQEVLKFKKLKSGIPGDVNNSWVERGPNQVAGRVRALMFDPNDSEHKKVWAGSVSGGLWYTNDITDENAIWHAVDNTWQNLAISSITYDPSNPSIYYVGTGEGWISTDARGLGIWKSTDAGRTWQHIASTKKPSFQTVQKVVVGKSGRVIAGTNTGIYTSDDYGNSWSKKTDGFISDIEIASNGTIYVGKGSVDIEGGIFKSTNNGTTWQEITPGSKTINRVELAISPSNPNTIYAVAAGSDNIAWLKKSTNGGGLWFDASIPKYLEGCSNSNRDFTRGQHWYNLILAVHPKNDKIIIAGGIDLNKSSNGGKTWNSISNWTGWCRPYVHADHHAIVFRPGHDNQAVFGNDGGVAFSDNVGDSPDPTFIIRNKEFNVTQFYSCAIHPDENKNYYLGGTQDNGTQRLKIKGVGNGDEVIGGDGGLCFIDKNKPTIQIASYTNNNYYYSTDGGESFKTLQKSDDGSFINPAAYDHNLGILYSAKSKTSVNRIKDIRQSPKIDSIKVEDMGSATSHISVSPYTTTSSTLLVGNYSGRLIKLTKADTDSPELTDIGSDKFPNAAVSSAEFGANEKEILLTFSNYGVKSIWYTNDGGKTWKTKDGNLPDMPIRWALFNPDNRKQVLLATEVGVWATQNFDAKNPTWTPSNSGLANVRVDMLRLRKSDNQVIAATHGRGLFTSDAFSKVNKDELKAMFSIKGNNIISLGENVEFENLSYGQPDSCLWTFEGATPGSSKDNNPTVKYIKKGNYKVTLTVYKGGKENSKTVDNYIEVEGKAGWIRQSVNFSEQSKGISYIDVVNADVVWALAYDASGSKEKVNEFARTLDGGKTWLSDTFNIKDNVGIAMIHAQNKDTAWAPAFPNGEAAVGGIYKTTDGGVTWTKQETAKFEGDDAFANVVYFWDNLNGFCMGDPNGGYFEIYTTKDGGDNWTRVDSTKIPKAKQDEYGTVGYFCVADDGTVFFNTTKGRILKSTDRGYSWKAIKTPLRGGNKCAFSDENNGVLIELEGGNVTNPRTYYTKDGGATWKRVKSKNVFNSYIKYVQNSGRMYVSTGESGSNAGASYSVDGGKTWTKFAKQNGAACMYTDFWDISTGWLGKYSNSENDKLIEKYAGYRTLPDFKIEVTNKEKREVSFTDITLSYDKSLVYEWDFGEDATPKTANTGGEHNVKYSKDGLKHIKLIVNGLEIEKELTISTTAVNDIDSNEDIIRVYPNPSDNEVTINFGASKPTNNRYIQVYKITGQLVYVDKVSEADKKTIALSKFGKGVYIIRVDAGKDVSIHKVVIR